MQEMTQLKTHWPFPDWKINGREYAKIVVLPINGGCSGCDTGSNCDVYEYFSVVVGQFSQLLTFPFVCEHGANVACNHNI